MSQGEAGSAGTIAERLHGNTHTIGIEYVFGCCTITIEFRRTDILLTFLKKYARKKIQNKKILNGVKYDTNLN
ncbi:hypothetical protein NQ317_006713 [Molorchus minor]|uniref:Uncharacterized protein n=1 Tax=Molorchus minor TaxID=1323400 RepID=A0ABQ9K185_9CUCU|nr:hypothetical protein NQ317_006713 [Molorchus minor]